MYLNTSYTAAEVALKFKVKRQLVYRLVREYRRNPFCFDNPTMK